MRSVPVTLDETPTSIRSGFGRYEDFRLMMVKERLAGSLSEYQENDFRKMGRDEVRLTNEESMSTNIKRQFL